MRIVLSLLCLMLFSIGWSQSVTDLSTTFSQIRTSSGVTMTDFLADQATGQGADDFVVNGIYVKYGLLNGVQTQFVRAVFTNYQSKGFGGNFKVGVDANADGALDIVYGIVDSGANKGITFQVPTTGSVSTGSTSLGAATNTIAFTATNYSYTVLDFGTSGYGMLTFAVPFSNVQNALSAQGITVDVNSFLRSIFFTATNQGAINQDIYGVSGINNALRFDAGGGFTEYQNFNGAIPVVPEPSTYGLIMTSFVSAFYFFKKSVEKRNDFTFILNKIENKSNEIAGEETQQTEVINTVSIKLPTEFTVSRASL